MDTVQLPLSRDLPAAASDLVKKTDHRHWPNRWERHMGHFRRGGLLITGAFVAVPVFAGHLNNVYADYKDKEDPWFQKLNYPTWTPPQPLFRPIWHACYTSMGIASFLVWRHGGGFGGKAQLPLLLYGTHLALNLSWVPVCYKTKSLKICSITSVGALTLAAASTATFHQIFPTAAYIMIPYLAWLSFETCLTIAMYRLNKTNQD